MKQPLHNAGAGERRARPARSSTTRVDDVEQRRGVVRRLPHLRRLRQPLLGPRRSRRRERVEQPEPDPLEHRRATRLPPAEGPDDDAEPARHGEPRADALARRPHRRLDDRRQPDRRRVRRGRRLQEVQRRLPRACSAATRAAHRRRHAGVHRLHPAGDLSAEPDPRARQLAHAARPSGRPAQLLLRRRPSSATRSAACNGCHVLDPAEGFFGSDGFTTFEAETQMFKIPHLRNMYQKVGMFGMPAVPFLKPGDNGDQGDQVRGFGFLHDGSVDTMFRFHSATVFNQSGGPRLPVGFTGDPSARDVEAFMLASTPTWRRSSASRSTLTPPTAAPSGRASTCSIARAPRPASATWSPRARSPASSAAGTASPRRRSSRDRSREPPIDRRDAARAGGDRRAGAHLHLRAAGLRRAHRRRPRRGRLLRRRRRGPGRPERLLSTCAMGRVPRAVSGRRADGPDEARRARGTPQPTRYRLTARVSRRWAGFWWTSRPTAGKPRVWRVHLGPRVRRGGAIGISAAGQLCPETRGGTGSDAIRLQTGSPRSARPWPARSPRPRRGFLRHLRDRARSGRWRSRPSQTRLFAVNTPGQPARDLRRRTPATAASRTPARCPSASSRSRSRRAPTREVWVVNHLSDSVSIVDVGATPPRVDAHAARRRRAARHRVRRSAASERALHHHRAPRAEHALPGHDRADPHHPGHRPRRRLGVRRGRPRRDARRARRSPSSTLFGDTPRALAVSPDGSTVYAAVFHSGNQTTPLSEGVVCNGGAGAPPCTSIAGEHDVPGRPAGAEHELQRRAAARGRAHRQVQRRDRQLGGRARPQLEQRVRFTCPTTTSSPSTPTRRAGGDGAASTGVGTVHLQHGRQPGDREVYVTNTEARNEVRFEGPAPSAARPSRATCTRRASRCSTARDVDAAPPEQAHRLRRRARRRPGVKDAQPRDAARHGGDGDGATLYVAAFGSSKVGVFDTTAARERHLHAERGEPHHGQRRRPERPRARRGARPALRAHALRQRDLGRRHRRRNQEIAHLPLHNPEPAARERRTAASSTTRAHVEQRRGVVRELPRLRRLRQPRLGPRQPRRRRAQQPEPDPSSRSARPPRTSIR